MTSLLLTANLLLTKSAIVIRAQKLVTKQLIYSQFGDPLKVVRYREEIVPKLGITEVLVRMLAAPINPGDMKIIEGRAPYLPQLPCVAGDEGVGMVVETGKLVSRVKPGHRVIINSRLLGTWRSYGIFDERALHQISYNIPIPEASMASVSPCTAYRMLKDYCNVGPGETVIQNGANNPCGQCVIQLCRAWGINTINIVTFCKDYENVKKYLLSLGASCVCCIEEVEDKCATFDNSLRRPMLALNCMGGKNEEAVVNIVAPKGAIVYYGCAYDTPSGKNELRRTDVSFNKFVLTKWMAQASCMEKDKMLSDVLKTMALGNLKAPLYETVDIKEFHRAFKKTASCEACGTTNFVFDLTMPI